MKKIVVFKFTVFDESTKQIAKEVAREFPGVTKVVEVEGEGQLEVRGEFSTFELTKELRKVDKSVETIKIRADGTTETEVKPQQQDEGKRPIKIEEVSKRSNDDSSSSNKTELQAYGWWEQAKGIAVGAAEKAKDIGVGAIGLIPLTNYEQQYNRNKNKEKEIKVKPQPKQGGGGYRPGKGFGWEDPQPQERRGIIEGVYDYLEKRKRQEKNRLHNERLKEQDMNRKKNWLEQMRKQGLANKSEGGTTQGSTVTGNTGSWWDTIRTGGASGSTQTLRTGEASASTQTLRTGKASASTQENRMAEKRKQESAAKKGKNGQ